MAQEPGHVRRRDRQRADDLAARPGRVTGRPGLGFELQITFWLWLTVLFANFAEAMAEGRGKAQADTLRKTRRPRRSPTAERRDGRSRRCRRRACARATSSASTPASSSRPTARSSKASRRSTSRDHRRVGAGHPRVGRRSVGGHRRHAGAVGLDPRPHHRQSRARPSSTA